MGKILSVLEKYKLIEKEDIKMSPSENSAQNASGITELDIKEEETVVSTRSKGNSSDPTPTSAIYNKNISLEEIYAMYHLNNCAATETVYVLENLMNALPSELPEYVKKTTLNNILIASSMNLQQLLTDGTTRYNHLNEFANNYTSQNENDITTLKQEIDKLTATMNDYHQQIKNKELLVKEQMSLIKLEEERLQNILSFFDK